MVPLAESTHNNKRPYLPQKFFKKTEAKVEARTEAKRSPRE